MRELVGCIGCNFMAFLFRFLIQKAKVMKHGTDHRLEIIRGPPIPVKASCCIIKNFRPGFSNGLTMIWTIVLTKMRNKFPDFFSQFLWCEGYSSHVVRSGTQSLLSKFHEFNYRTEAVVQVHHWQSSVRSQVVCVLASFQGIVENLNGIVCQIIVKCKSCPRK